MKDISYHQKNKINQVQNTYSALLLVFTEGMSAGIVSLVCTTGCISLLSTSLTSSLQVAVSGSSSILYPVCNTKQIFTYTNIYTENTTWAAHQVKQQKGWRMGCDVGKATEGLENEL